MNWRGRSLFFLALILATQHETLAGHVIGIDLGTSYSRVAVYRNGEVEIIPNKRGNLHTPSYVAFSGSSVLRGDDAKDQFHLNPENTIYSFKRYLGMRYDEVEAWTTTYRVVNNDGRAAFQVHYNGEQTTFTPEEVAAQLLIELKESAEAYLGSKVTDAVVSVSGGSFNLPRQATLDAARIAGLDNVRLINAATATAIEYSITAGYEEKIVAVVDIGGGALDFSVGFVADGICDIVGTADTPYSLSGDFIDHLIMKTILHHVKGKYKVDLDLQPQTVQQLKTAAENAKIALSSVVETAVTISDGDRDMTVTIYRDNVTQATADPLNALVTQVSNVLTSVRIYETEIEEFLIVGGSTRIPEVSAFLSRFFGLSAYRENPNSEEFTVVSGAALAGTMEDGVMSSLFMLDAIPRAIRLKGVDEFSVPILPMYSRMPTVKSEALSTASGNVNNLSVNIYEGNHVWNPSNHFLGSIEISGIPPGMPGGFMVWVTFEVDQNGICDFTLQDSTYDLLVKNGRLSEDEISSMAERAQLL